ncbi:MAG TPA: amidohydrolase [Bacteroidia bacterium]|nr:amidohydrolase [Bacteroidia bacterium]
MENLSVTIIQTSLHWHNRSANFNHFEKLMEKIQNTNLIVLPEMFSSGFTMEAGIVADELHGEVLAWMQQLAVKKNATITSSTVIKEDGKFFNRLLWVNADGSFEQYNKKHLFRMAGENNTYTEGNKRLITSIGNWKICPMICYDLRFPVFSRNVNWNANFDRNHQYDILIYTANWPERRNHAWKSLLVARAIENQCYVIGVNRIGVDGNEILYSGDSMVINPLGEIISNTKAFEESVETIELNKRDLVVYRKAFPANDDADEFMITL